MWLPIVTAKWVFHKWKKCVGHSKWTRFSTDPYYFKTWGWCRLQYIIDSPRHHDACFQAIWSLPVPAGRLALWHCEHAGAREIPRKSTWKEAARTGTGSVLKTTANWWLNCWKIDSLLCNTSLRVSQTRGRKHQWISYQNHWSVFGRSGRALVLRHPSDITIQKCSLPPLNCFWKLTRRATRLRLIELKSRKDLNQHNKVAVHQASPHVKLTLK